MASTTTGAPPTVYPSNLSHFCEVSENDVLKIIKNSLTKSSFLDPVSTFLLKDCVDILIPSITKLANLSLVDGVFPQQFKKALVTPLIKKASLPNEDLKNYRPVSGLYFMSILLEWVVVKQLMQHINSNNLDNPHQSAYKTGHSKLFYCIFKMRSIPRCHMASLQHLSYLIYQPPSIQLTMILF